jgi:phosphoglycerate dehydrogenase-like enzyme/2-keto-3-deoxy-L-rhamnonate aldolase RhmA
MKTSALRALRSRLAADSPVFGLWVTLEAPSITEMAVALGLDWVVIDAEHGHLDWKEILEHVRATVRSDTVALVRLAELNGGLIKRALDVGADGVVIPWVESAEQLRQAIAFARYPLEGVRGIGAERATGWGQCLAEHTAEANAHVLVVPILETVRAAAEVETLSRVEGAELYLLGPADFSASAGYRGQWEGPGVAQQLLAMKDTLRRAGKHCGIMATSDADIHRRLGQGFRAIGLGMDAGLLLRSLRGALTTVGRDRAFRASLAPAAEVSAEESRSAARLETRKFRVALTGDFHDADGRLCYRDIGLSTLAGAPGIEVGRLSEHRAEIAPEQLAGVNGVIVLTPRVTAHSLSASDELLAVARFGVGYDSVDVPACTAADVVLFITRGAVDRPVAEATVAWMLALTHHVRTKDRLVREGRWHDRNRYMGSELRERTLGVIGFGGIGREVVRLLAGFGMNPPLVYDPFAAAEQVAASGARAVTLNELLAGADFVSIHCPLTEQTRNLITARELGRMKPTAYLINTARGGIVDEEALDAALAEGRITGAAIDCFREEPMTVPPRFARHENVLLAPHAIAWTDELFRDIGRAACQGMLDLSQGRRPAGVVNPEVFDRPSFQQKWRRLTGRE